MLITGPEGSGALPVALGIAQYLMCEGEKDSDGCGECPSCQKVEKLIHPDLHFTYPVISSGGSTPPISADYISQWRKAVLANPYMNLNDWLQSIGAENKQGNIPAKECHELIRKLGLKSFGQGNKIVIIWMAELLKNDGNRLLKLLEEPPDNTFLILTANDTDQILNTILSRTQIIKLQVLSDQLIMEHLIDQYGLEENRAWDIAYLSNGNLNQAVRQIDKPIEQYVEQFRLWMRHLFKNNIKELVNWISDMASTGRENQKQFIEFALHFFRESMMFSQVPGYRLRLQENEYNGAKYIAEHVEVGQLEQISSLLENMHYYISRNAHPKVQFMNLSLETLDYLHNRKSAQVERAIA